MPLRPRIEAERGKPEGSRRPVAVFDADRRPGADRVHPKLERGLVGGNVRAGLSDRGELLVGRLAAGCCEQVSKPLVKAGRGYCRCH
jgi:hypothetical protein